MKKKWLLRRTNIDIKELASNSSIYGITTKVLVNREINTSEKIKSFFDTSLSNLHDAFLMKDMEKGIEIITNGIKENKKILIYGDYDADGVTSTTILYKTLKNCNAEVDFHIPDRESEGYGMSKNRIKKIKEEGFDIIITCDNGISALEEIKFAKELGFTVIVTDHHELPFVEENDERKYILPEADAIINPKRFDCEYPFVNLCGAGIAFKFSQALLKRFNKDENFLKDIIQYAAIGTICDVVDLVDENRVIAINGLKEMCKTKNKGLQALINVLGVQKDNIKSYNIGFQIGPCINATGRLEKADLSFELLVTEDEGRAKELAKILFELNKKRQDMTNENVELILNELKAGIKDKVLVIYKEDIHESIAGIVAGRVRETYNLPAFVLTGGKEMPKGSGRSIDEYNMFEEMIKCKDVLNKFGGHPMAAGLSIEEDKIDLFREKLNENCTLKDDDVIPKLRIDNRLPLEYISKDLITELSNLEPFGKGNSKPIFAEKNIEILDIKILGKNQNTLKLICKIGNTRKTIDAIGFNKVDTLLDELKESFGACYNEILKKPKGLKLDLAFFPSLNEFSGKVSLVLKIEDLRVSNI
ncbi:single-stranded-DNA-specific exonuclease RecJ [Oceanirhabdus seepicola]|uniref:Single-stranded-DNA-specific exonuclease RecJ n=1 Tax=Oceanirhabdus seepicola TaxID=2828781 RepID=A0A9J6NYC0_9CLOT|nr:single-stranded-DNA-specific exonuclease RecJ [Oceanirhabdus seepicola]